MATGARATSVAPLPPLPSLQLRTDSLRRELLCIKVRRTRRTLQRSPVLGNTLYSMQPQVRRARAVSELCCFMPLPAQQVEMHAPMLPFVRVPCMPHVPTKKACPSLGDAHTSLRPRLHHQLLLVAHKACGRATALGKQEFTARVDGDDDGHGLRASDVPERVLVPVVMVALTLLLQLMKLIVQLLLEVRRR